MYWQLMDQKKATEPPPDPTNFQGPIPGQPTQQIQISPPHQVGPVPPPQQQQWFAHPQMAQVAPNMFVYQNQLYPFTNPNMNMNMMAIPFQPAPGQMGAQFVQIPIQSGPHAAPMQQTPQQAQPVRNPRIQNGYNYNMPPQSQMRAPSPHQSQAGGNSSHYNGPQGQQPYHARGNYHNVRGNRPQRNGGYSNGSSMNNNSYNSRSSYHQQHGQQRLPNNMQQQPFIMNNFQGQPMPLVQSPDFRRGNPPPQQQNFGNPQVPNGFPNVQQVYHHY